MTNVRVNTVDDLKLDQPYKWMVYCRFCCAQTKIFFELLVKLAKGL